MSARRMLVVDDDPLTRRLLRAIFAAEGWEVALAASVTEAEDLLNPPPDYLVLDLTLPGGDGTELLRLVRERALPTRVAVTTGEDDPDRLAVIKSLRPEAILLKPIAVDDLREAFSSGATESFELRRPIEGDQGRW